MFDDFTFWFGASLIVGAAFATSIAGWALRQPIVAKRLRAVFSFAFREALPVAPAQEEMGTDWGAVNGSSSPQAGCTWSISSELKPGNAGLGPGDLSNERRLTCWANSPKGNSMIQRQRQALEHFDRHEDKLFSMYLPLLVDRVTAGGLQGNVFLLPPDHYCVSQIHAGWGGQSTNGISASTTPGIEGEHIGWMFNRLLEILGFVHRSGFVHGGIYPHHIWFDVRRHGLQLMGWGNSGALDSATHGQEPRLPSDDIRDAADAMLWLASPKLHPRLLAFLASCTLHSPRMRPRDAWQLRDEFGELLETVYGPPRFHEFPREWLECSQQ